MIGRVALAAAGAFLVAVALRVPRAAIPAMLAPDASGERLGQLLLGAGLLKGLLALHGACLLGAGLLPRPRGARVHAPLWKPPPGAGSSRTAPPMLAAAAAVLAVGALLRAIGLDQDLWHDEVFTLVDFVRPPVGAILTDYSDDNQHLLYSLLAHASIAQLGESAAALRLPAVAFGVASLWATWRLGRLVAGEREALFAAALLAVSYHHVWFSQNARGYTGLLFATVLSTDLLLRALWRGRTSLWLGYAASLALGMAIHLSMVFVAAGHALVALGLCARARAPAWRPLAAFALAGTLTLQVYALVLPQLLEFYLQPGGGTTTAAVEWKSPLWTALETVRGLGGSAALGGVGLLGALLLLGAGGASYLARAPAATVCFILPAVLGAAAFLALGRNLWPRFFFHEAGFAALFAVRGAFVLGERAAAWTRRDGARFGVALAGGLVLASALTLPRVYRPKQDFTGARDFVLRAMGPADRVVGVGMAGEAYHFYYAPEIGLAMTLQELEAQRATEGRTWLLYSFGSYIEATQPALWDAIETRFEEVRAFPGTLGGGTIVVRRSREAIDRARPAESSSR